MTNVTLRTLGVGAAPADGDLFLTRQGADTVDKSVTGLQLKTFIETAAPVTSVNAQTGAVVLTAADVGAATTLAALTDVVDSGTNLLLSGTVPAGAAGATYQTALGQGALASVTAGANANTAIGQDALTS